MNFLFILIDAMETFLKAYDSVLSEEIFESDIIDTISEDIFIDGETSFFDQDVELDGAITQSQNIQHEEEQTTEVSSLLDKKI